MAYESIKKIKDTEASAESVVKHAQESAHKIIFEAKLEIGKVMLNAETQAELEAGTIRDTAIGAANGEIKNIEEDTKNQKSSLRKKAAENMGKAVNIILEEAKKTWA